MTTPTSFNDWPFEADLRLIHEQVALTFYLFRVEVKSLSLQFKHESGHFVMSIDFIVHFNGDINTRLEALRNKHIIPHVYVDNYHVDPYTKPTDPQAFTMLFTMMRGDTHS